ncbi:GBF-interacting protein 1-like isoform X1 [Tripterygium wilfordii]|uniref:GBF-interacting protein 1-like isoform X1 n=1 Tax=Tripterygium wilfordii TaxID=458696 RepID=UPI0018F84683|nr:GBF-interacting protein 1-like isoform X1 [Tripterygium wilfordii]
MSGGGYRVQIPNSVRKTIQNIKEITGNHSEEEIYAMLKECSMDPNETAQRLLFQDPFHEVKRKRDKRKENLNNRESAESRWRATTQVRGSRGGRANFSPRHTSNDTGSGGGRNSGAERSVGPLPVSPETESKEATLSASSAAIVANGPTVVASESTGVVHSTNFAAGNGINQPERILSTTGINKLESALPPVDADKSPSIAFGTGDMGGEPVANSSNSSLLMASSSSSAVCFSSSDPVLVPTSDSWLPGAVGAIKREVGSNRTSGEQNSVVPAETKLASASEIGGTLQGKMPSSRFQGVGKTPMLESSQPSSSSTHGGSSGSRPSSNYSNRSQAIFGPQKVGSNKEWKPKPTAPGVAQGSGTGVSSDVASISIKARAQSLAVNVLDSEEATSELQKKLEELHLPQHQHVIIPNHIHVPESERTKLSFGSFDASFGVTSSFVSAQQSFVSAQQSEKSSTPLSETSHGLEEPLEEQAASSPNALETAEEEGAYPEHPQSPSNIHNNFSGEGDVSSSVVQEFEESKQESALSGGHQYSVVHTSPNYNYGFMPPIIGSQASAFENSESQARDVSRFPSFVVQQPFDPTSYYAQFYQSGADSDGRVSPFPTPAVSTKYNGNVAVLPPQNSQSPQEGGNLVLSASGPTPLVTQAAGLMQSSLAVTQQPLPVFRPPAGLHISPYPPNCIPYGHYFSPFYVPSPGIHQFLSNGGFPQQPQAGGVYTAPPGAASGVKYPLPQYKSATNSGNSTQIGVPSGYGPYSSSPAGYNPSAAATAGNSASNEDLATSQFKENNVYNTGQQSEGSAVWIAGPPGRDISSLPSTPFYNLPPQGQHMTFAPSQAGHGPFTGIYHPAQAATAAGVHPLLQQSQTMAGAVDMVGPTAGVYQQPQHAQINWPGNY